MIVLTVGPKNNPVTGQSKCFDYFVSGSNHEILNIYTTGSSRFYFLNYVFSVIYCALFCRYDAIYFTSSRSKLGFIRDLILILANYHRKLKIVNHLHGADFKVFYSSSSRLLKVFIDLVYNRLDFSIVLSDGMSDQYLDYPDMKTEVVPNFFDDNEVGSLSVHKKDEPLQILFLSNLIESKGYKEIYDTVISINKNRRNSCILNVAGGAFDRKAFDFLSSIDSQDVIYHGVVTADSKKELLSKSHLLVLPTYYPTEAQPLSIIEGMASGCFIISTKHNYIPELISERNGILLDLGLNPTKKEICSGLEQAILSVLDGEFDLESIMLNNLTESSVRFSGSVYVNTIDKILES